LHSVNPLSGKKGSGLWITDITISTLRRDINIINNMTDGSIKLGEIHFNKSNYRELSDKPLPAFLKKWIRSYWMKQLIRKLRKLKRFIVLSYEDAAEWTELNNVTVIHNPLPFFPDSGLTECNRLFSAFFQRLLDTFRSLSASVHAMTGG
jgi:hypothetical protein